MLELRHYQEQSLDALKEYLRLTVQHGAKTAFVLQTDRPYRAVPQLPGLPYVCLRVPTGGGKTFMACHALGIAATEFLHADRAVCLWLVPTNTIREQTFCCGSGSGLNNDEFMEMRMRGGLPRANAVRYVKEKFGVNAISCICAIDRAALTPLMDYWVEDVTVYGVHELVGNALVMEDETERTTDLRGEPLPGMEDSENEDI